MIRKLNIRKNKEQHILLESSKTMSRSNERFVFLLIVIMLNLNTFCSGLDTITMTQVIKDGETLISSDGSFEMGFFCPGNSKNRYVGIWYKNIPDFTVVWVANRDTPLTNLSGSVLKFSNTGNLVLVDGNNTIIWSTNYTSQQSAKNPVAKLLDSGNLVVKEANDDSSDTYLWQGFDHPTDTQLPGMKLGWNFITGHETILTSWKNSEDPGRGDYTTLLDIAGYPQLVIRRNNDEVYRTGSWNGEGYNGVPGLKKNNIFSFDLVYTDKEAYYRYDLRNNSVKSRFVLNYTGFMTRWTWSLADSRRWNMYLSAPSDSCDYYNPCRGYGICNTENFPICNCLNKFVPKSPDKWAANDWSDGCVRRRPFDCKTDGFIRYRHIKLPDERYAWGHVSMSLRECEVMCGRNCSCVAYASLDVRNGGSGCLLWSGDLVDIKQLYVGTREIFIRMAYSESESRSNKKKILLGTLTSFAVVFFLGVCITLFIRRRSRTHLKLRELVSEQPSEIHHREDMELPLYDFSTIAKATNNFSPNNKLGEGGFGPVYKGILENGQEIAVKRLAKTSMQGMDEFKNEVIFIVKLQHRNLVKLLGCCIEVSEKMLIYEYMSNRSLDLILFEPTLSKLLDWPRRFRIITGIARGLLYLHQDSRLRIVHRDLKTSNILLDSKMNPKISDFGVARSFGANDVEASTSRIVGTYGYMSPEYAIDGIFSVKSDVFSFGVIVLEILSGKRNRRFTHTDHHHNLLGHAWVLYKEGRSMELINKSLGESFYSPDVIKTVHVGLLCVQQNPEDRPSMSSVVFMLENDVVLARPKEPGFFTERNVFAATDTLPSTYTFCSENEITMTLAEAR